MTKRSIGSTDYIENPWLRQRIRGESAAEPTNAIDRRILDYARRAAGRTARSPYWIWPMSVAAAVMVCAGLLFGMMRLLPDPVVVVMEPPPTPREVRPAQAVGGEAPAGMMSGAEASPQVEWRGELADAQGAPEYATVVEWMRQALAEGDGSAFAYAYGIYQELPDQQPLPEDLQIEIVRLNLERDASTIR